jgi:cephalosporin hydroxylase
MESFLAKVIIMTITEPKKFQHDRQINISKMARDTDIRAQTLQWICDTARYKYTYNFEWMGRPVIQFPQDMFAMQELIWKIKPQLMIETGIAHGGSLIFYSSMLELLGGDGMVLGIDIDIRAHNRIEIEKHPMVKRIEMIEGSSTDNKVISQVHQFARGKAPVIVVLDSMHTHSHVLQELNAYSPLVPKGSYLVVFDTVVEDMPEGMFPDRPWGKGNNPKTAVWEFLKSNDRFEIDKDIENKLLITVAPDGYLRCIKD